MFSFFKKASPSGPTPATASSSADADVYSPEQRMLFDGIEAYKAKDYSTATKCLMGAIAKYPPSEGGRRTAYIYLGMTYRRLADFEIAVKALEEGLPYPAAFDELKAIFRVLAKAAKKEGNAKAEADNYRKMYSITTIQVMVLEQRLPMSRQVTWMEDFKGKLYWCGATAEGIDRVEKAELLSATDCAALRKHLIS